ncbi:LysR family transcriptional regulator [Vibrio sp. LaRot3]|uniref:LysR family transcriptional regulator n=1 Tax=Vibrio sp. LaRot3 TaxID=2998829 RepID=UPI0022CE2930|nr:LysR family transcriptional regulator [Vibrio sp. LaRot3]MDA0148119.1 LysR family transcriptional regulator [Vibrio sp. LaRot3]
MISHINLNLLRSLQVLLQECHVSLAAQRLNLTQSAVSRQLAQLRELTADPLLVREGNQLVPTSRALSIQAKLNQILGEVDELLSDRPFEPSQWQQEFVFSSSDYVAQFIVPEVTALLAEQAPSVDFSYQLFKPNYLHELHPRGIDLASTMLPHQPEHLSSIKLGQDYSVVLMRQQHPLSLVEMLSNEDIVRYPHLKVTGGGDKDSHADLQLKQQSYKRRIAVKVPFFNVAVDTLLTSDLLMIVPEHIALTLCNKAALTYKALPFTTSPHQYWLMWHPKFDGDAAHQWMREQILNVMTHSTYSIGMK